MQAAGSVSGGSFVFMDMDIGFSAIAGQPLQAAATNGEGLITATSTTACTNYVGISTQAVTQVNTQLVGTDQQASMQVGINPDMILRVRMSGTAATGGALATIAALTISADGLDNGGVGTASFTIWGHTGPNTETFRVQSAADVPSVAWPYVNAVGDEWLEAGCNVGMFGAGITLTTELDEFDASGTFNTTDNFNAVRVEGYGASHEGTTKSYVHVVPGDPYWGNT